MYKDIYSSTENLSSKLIDRAIKIIADSKTGKKVSFGNDYYLNIQIDFFKPGLILYLNKGHSIAANLV